MNLRESFQAVIDDPDADAPRLAYADACEAAGDRDRAEFIRIQVEETARKRAARPDSLEFYYRRLELRDANAVAWAGPIAKQVAGYGFFRGFVERISVDARVFLARAEELYQLAPIRRLTLTGVAPVIDELFRSPHLGRIVSLALERQNLGDREMEVLAGSPYLGKLADLSLGWNKITVAGVEAMAASSRLPALKCVWLCWNPADTVSEGVWNDQGVNLKAEISVEGQRLEEKYGPKAWLHPVRDRGLRDVDEAEF